MRSNRGAVATVRRQGTIAAYALLAVTTVTGCAEIGPEACTEIGATGGIAIKVLPPLPDDPDATVTVCTTDDQCTEHTLTLHPGTMPVDHGCRGTGPDAPCSATSTPDGTLRGFVTVPELSADEVAVTLELAATDGSTDTHGPTSLSPEQANPNGPGCPPTVYQAQLTVTGRE